MDLTIKSMPGTAKTSSFLLSSATVMIGAMGELDQLNPADHSIGLVKNFSMSSNPRHVELMHDLPDTLYMSVKATDGLSCSMEVYEYTARNLAYASGFAATDTSYDLPSTVYSTNASAARGATGIIVDGDASTLINKWITIQAPNSDLVHLAEVLDADYDGSDTVLTFTDYALPKIFPVGSQVGISKQINVGGTAKPVEYICAKVVGLLPRNNKPFVILFPKIKITKGLQINFSETAFQNLPFEFTPYSMIESDPLHNRYGRTVAILSPSATDSLAETVAGGIVLLDEESVTGDWKIWPGGGLAFWDIYGVWNGATATLQQSPDDGVTAISYSPYKTENGFIDSLNIPAGRKVRVLIAGGSSPVLSSTLVLQ